MPPEELILVTDFASLREMDLIVMFGCTGCGGKHRGMLIAFHPNAETSRGCTGKREDNADTWEAVPPPHGSWAWGITPDIIPLRVLYRVVIPPVEETADTDTNLPQTEVARGIRELLGYRR